jgi:hypothetical protein
MDLDPNFKAIEMLAKHGDSARVQAEQVLAMAEPGSKDWKHWNKVKNLLPSASSYNKQRRHRSSPSDGGPDIAELLGDDASERNLPV